MRMDAGVDTGPILVQVREPIHADDTTLTLGARLAGLGARLMVETLPKVFRGEIAPIAQDESQASLAPKIVKDDGRIDWTQPALHIERMIRAYTPWPGAFTRWNELDLHIVRAAVETSTHQPTGATVGQVIALGRSRAGVVTGDGVLAVYEVQLSGRRAMSIEEFARGQPRFIGSLLA
jgi:methionyl-tRNA formyltransferase